MTVSNGDILRCSARFNLAGYGDVMNVFWFECYFLVDQSDGDVMIAVDGALSQVFAEFDNYINQNTNPVDLKVDVVQHLGGKWEVVHNVGYQPWGSTLNTADTGEVLPPGAAGLVRLLTGLGKHYGRKFVGHFTESTNVIGFLSSALQTALATGFSHLLVGYTVNTGSIIRGCVPDYQAGIVRVISDIVVNAAWSYQRRRRQGVGS